MPHAAAFARAMPRREGTACDVISQVNGGFSEMYSRNPSLLKPIPQTIHALLLSVCFLLGAATVCPSFAQTKDDKRIKEVESERNKLNKLTNPEDRAKSLLKIATITLTFANDAIAAKDIPGLASSVEEYQRTMTVALETMMRSGLDAYKNPKGYQAIEVATRSHLRILEDFSRRLPLEERPPVDQVIERVSKIRDEIVRVLFS
jgi:hypothetical protein